MTTVNPLTSEGHNRDSVLKSHILCLEIDISGTGFDFYPFMLSIRSQLLCIHCIKSSLSLYKRSLADSTTNKNDRLKFRNIRVVKGLIGLSL